MIGEGSPTRPGIGCPAGGLLAADGGRVAAAERAAFVDRPRVGRHARRGRHGDDRERSLEEPADVLADVRRLAARSPGLGPSRLARELCPLPLATKIVLPSRETRTEVGYQPVGMKPSGVLAPGSLTFTTARLLVLALATKRIDSSAESASELGVQPGGRVGSMAVPIVSMALPAAVSITLTELRLALAT